MAARASISNLPDQVLVDGFMHGDFMWAACIAAPDGCIYAPPCNASHVLRVDPTTGTVESVGPEIPGATWKYAAAAIGPDGCLYAPPCSAARVLRVDLTPGAGMGAVSFLGPEYRGRHLWHSAVLGPDGNIYAVPCNANLVMCVDCRRGNVRLIGPELLGGEGKWCAAALGGDGRIYAPPCNANRVLRVYASTQAVEQIGPDMCCIAGAGWVCALRGSDGHVYAPPFNADQVLRLGGGCTGGVGVAEEKQEEERDERAEKGPPYMLGPKLSGFYKWSTVVLGPDGLLYAPPCSALKVLRVDGTHGAVELFEEELLEGYKEKYRCAVLASDGCIYGMPYHAQRVLQIHCGTATARLIGPLLPDREQKWRAAAVGSDGSSLCAPPCHAGQLLRVGAVPSADDGRRLPDPVDVDEDAGSWLGPPGPTVFELIGQTPPLPPDHVCEDDDEDAEDLDVDDSEGD